ncbi:biopolymer transporter ExbD [Temperatibacter marinus]|uniref:Biopolymer transporter ExbD n=1 Tax=Temperatibacter marinus TaxID=1456591 RepID=A0AA52H8W3_9PROT|nr:biopolymer transporter ExbD [Temperatibacter marinus]WND01882.1 biopolymer transporter ExbD [Temperatibacter marinus]
MGMQLGGGSIKSRRGAAGRYRPLAEINVTPFVDVMLVLLIIFMVAAPLLQPGVLVDLPKASVKTLPQDSKPLEITIDPKGDIFIADNAIADGELKERLYAIAGNNRDVKIYIRGDTSLEYGRIMQVIGMINAAGFTKVALMADNR